MAWKTRPPGRSKSRKTLPPAKSPRRTPSSATNRPKSRRFRPTSPRRWLPLMLPSPHSKARFRMSTDSSIPSLETTTIPTQLRASDDDLLFDRLEKSIRQGDWNAVSRLIRQLEAAPLPPEAAALGERLRHLQSVLVSARIGRAGLAVALSRARAAARFTYSCD